MGKRFFGRKLFISAAVGSLIVGVIAYLVFIPFYVLSIKDLSNGKTVLEKPAAPGDNLWIVFINSVEKLPVADHFVVSEKYKIVFSETIYQAPYAGYDRSEKAELIAPGTLKISGYDRQMEVYTFYAGEDFRHMLFLNGNWLPLYEAARGGDLIQIAVIKRSRLSAYLFSFKRAFFNE